MQITDIIPYITILSILANIGQILAFTLIGPLPYIPYTISFPIAEVCAGLLGCCEGFVFISTLIRAQKEAIEEGYSKESGTYLLISGNVNTLFMGRDHITHRSKIVILFMRLFAP